MLGKRKNWFKVLFFIPLAFLGVSKTVEVCAGREQKPSYFLESPRYGKDQIFLPTKFISIVIDGSQYYYCDGIFYRRGLYKYVVVEPPVGAMVPALPLGYEMVVIEGLTYYTYKGIYYQAALPSGYVVVPQPVSEKPSSRHQK